MGWADTHRSLRANSEATEFRYEREAQPLPKIRPWSDKLDQLLLANEGKASRERLTLIRLFEELRGRGYGGGYDAVRRYARRWSKERGYWGRLLGIVVQNPKGERNFEKIKKGQTNRTDSRAVLASNSVVWIDHATNLRDPTTRETVWRCLSCLSVWTISFVTCRSG